MGVLEHSHSVTRMMCYEWPTVLKVPVLAM